MMSPGLRDLAHILELTDHEADQSRLNMSVESPHLSSPSRFPRKFLQKVLSLSSISMAVDPLQFLSLIAFLSALEARGLVSLATGLTDMTIYFPLNRLLDSTSCGPSNTRTSASNIGFFDHASEGSIQDHSTPDSGSPLGFSDTTSSTASFPLLYQFLLIFSGQLASISQDILSLRRSVASLESSLSAVEDQITLLTNAHESILAQSKDESCQTHTIAKASSDSEELGQQLHHPSSIMTTQQVQMSALRDTVCATHVSPDHQPLAECTRSYKDFDAPQQCLRAQFTTQIQDHIECKKDYAALRQDLQKLSDLASINYTKTNVSLDHLRSQIVDQVKDQNRTEKEVALLREQMTRKFGAFQSRVSSLTLDAMKVHHSVQLSDQAAKEARRTKAMAGVSRRIMQLQDTVPQNNENGAVVPPPCSSPISVGHFQDSDVFKALPPCVQRIGTTAPSDTKVLHSPPPSRQYINCKENVDGIHSPSTKMAFRQEDAVEVGILRRKQKGSTITAFQPKVVNWMPMPSPSSPALSAIQRGHVSASRIFKPGDSDSEYRNKSLYASPLNSTRARTRGWI
ncbi:hypothetical protein DFJ58DRAFT_774721 [Suillus subalutaceus]|uniref:uncharacterized protein n=1 Tax=Suillus subalutaceus TaxID=48586 RepID=UPI001B85F425|nr:uncharacterized protein DFJ58DRAFT_774721 [Suillus subalutaceus]KAG1862728.1 hypothetical protein DFJ58DRAFT_774721 [Suillus subalutaceus]